MKNFELLRLISNYMNINIRANGNEFFVKDIKSLISMSYLFAWVINALRGRTLAITG